MAEGGSDAGPAARGAALPPPARPRVPARGARRRGRLGSQTPAADAILRAELPGGRLSEERRNPERTEAEASDPEKRENPSEAFLQATRLADDRTAEVTAAISALKSDNDAFRAKVELLLAERYERGRQRLLVSSVQTLETLDRAIDAAREGGAAEPLIAGVMLVRMQLFRILQEEGLERVRVLGLPYDPASSDLARRQPVTDAEQDGKVIEELQRGHRLRGHVVRRAKVVVGELAPEAPLVPSEEPPPLPPPTAVAVPPPIPTPADAPEVAAQAPPVPEVEEAAIAPASEPPPPPPPQPAELPLEVEATAAPSPVPAEVTTTVPVAAPTLPAPTAAPVAAPAAEPIPAVEPIPVAEPIPVVEPIPLAAPIPAAEPIPAAQAVPVVPATPPAAPPVPDIAPPVPPMAMPPAVVPEARVHLEPAPKPPPAVAAPRPRRSAAFSGGLALLAAAVAAGIAFGLWKQMRRPAPVVSPATATPSTAAIPGEITATPPPVASPAPASSVAPPAEARSVAPPVASTLAARPSPPPVSRPAATAPSLAPAVPTPAAPRPAATAPPVNPVPALLAQAAQAAASRSFDEAIAKYDEVLRLEPANTEAAAGRRRAAGERAAVGRFFNTIATVRDVGAEAKKGSRGVAGFEGVGTVAEQRDYDCKIEYRVMPSAPVQGQPFAVEVSLINTGKKDFKVQSVTSNVSVNGSAQPHPVTLLARQVPRGLKVAVARMDDVWEPGTTGWWLEVAVRGPGGDTYRAQLTWDVKMR